MLGAEDIKMEKTHIYPGAEDSETLRGELLKVMQLVINWFQN